MFLGSSKKYAGWGRICARRTSGVDRVIYSRRRWKSEAATDSRPNEERRHERARNLEGDQTESEWRSAIPAPTSKQQPRQHGNQIERADGRRAMLAIRASSVRRCTRSVATSPTNERDSKRNERSSRERREGEYRDRPREHESDGRVHEGRPGACEVRASSGGPFRDRAEYDRLVRIASVSLRRLVPF